MIQVTIAQVAEQLGVSRDAAYMLMRFLVETQQATKIGTTKVPGKGRGADIYSLDLDEVVQQLTALLPKLRKYTATEGQTNE